MPRCPLAALAILLCGAAHAAPKLPADVTLKEPLGFRKTKTLKDEGFVIPGNHFLPKGTRMRLLDSSPAFGTAGAFCAAEALGKRGYVRCDKPGIFEFAGPGQSAPKQAAPPKAQGGQQQAAPAKPLAPGRGLGQYCHDVDSCKTFCKAHCKLDLAKWGKGVSSTCSFPSGLGGSIPPGSPLLKPLPAMKFIKGAKSVRATEQVLAGLQRLDAHLASASGWPQGHTIEIKSCYRSDIADSTNECDYILKGWHLKEKWAALAPKTKADQDQKALGERLINPPKNLGLMWPGATPHSAGLGCDMVVQDAGGKDVTACRMSKADAKAKAASKALVDAVTSDQVGAVRLNFEGWHFEWGGAITGCRCKGDECNTKHWPTLCDGPQHCSRPE